jgi:hypothetical protein
MVENCVLKEVVFFLVRNGFSMVSGYLKCAKDMLYSVCFVYYFIIQHPVALNHHCLYFYNATIF